MRLCSMLERNFLPRLVLGVNTDLFTKCLEITNAVSGLPLIMLDSAHIILTIPQWYKALLSPNSFVVEILIGIRF